MNIVLWILQILLAFAFLSHARLMIFPPNQIVEGKTKGMQYVMDIPSGFRRFLGVAEGLGAVGLILSGLTNILPWLTIWAALGLIIVVAGAIIYHIFRREYPNLVLNGVLLAMATFVAYMRWFVLPL